MTNNRYKIILEYIGKDFCGWQKQKEAVSIQGIIEGAIYKFSQEETEVFAAGRTDSGVHAYGQVAHFDLSQKYDTNKLMLAINHFSRPHRVGVIACEEVNLEFHARFSAITRHYVYKILNRKGTNIIDNGFKLWIRDQLDIKNMQMAADYLIGRHDFSAFRSSDCQAQSPIKTIHSITISIDNDNIDIYISAPSFLHHMVRNIVGSLIMVGRGIWQAERMKIILDSKSRKLAGPMAPAEGLYFLHVDYYSKLNIV